MKTLLLALALTLTSVSAANALSMNEAVLLADYTAHVNHNLESVFDCRRTPTVEVCDNASKSYESIVRYGIQVVDQAPVLSAQVQKMNTALAKTLRKGYSEIAQVTVVKTVKPAFSLNNGVYTN